MKEAVNLGSEVGQLDMEAAWWLFLYLHGPLSKAEPAFSSLLALALTNWHLAGVSKHGSSVSRLTLSGQSAPVSLALILLAVLTLQEVEHIIQQDFIPAEAGGAAQPLQPLAATLLGPSPAPQQETQQRCLRGAHQHR